MKKLLALLSLFSLTACVYAGDVSVLDSRKGWVEWFSSYPIDFYDGSERLVKSEMVTEDSYPNNQILTAYVGYTVVDVKTYRKDFFATEYLRANMKGVLNSASVPVVFEKNERKKVIGEVEIDDVSYLMVPTSLKDFVALVKRDGTVWHKMGQIRHGRLVLLDPDFLIFPESFRFEPLVSSRMVQTEPVKGFDIKYEGIKLDRMVFTYMSYADAQGDRGSFENLTYPDKPGLIDINGVGIKVLHAGNQKLDYIIIKK